jgi:hypothetical protein
MIERRIEIYLDSYIFQEDFDRALIELEEMVEQWACNLAGRAEIDKYQVDTIYVGKTHVLLPNLGGKKKEGLNTISHRILDQAKGDNTP